MRKPTKAIRNHTQFDANDYAYLVAKGWSDAEILARWDEEAARGQGPCRWDHPVAKAKLAATVTAYRSRT